MGIVTIYNQGFLSKLTIKKRKNLLKSLKNVYLNCSNHSRVSFSAVGDNFEAGKNAKTEKNEAASF